MIGFTPSATSQASDSLRLFELASDPKKLRKSLDSLMDEQKKLQDRISEMRATIKEREQAESKANAAAAAALEDQANSSNNIRAAVSALAELEAKREEIARARDEIAATRLELDGLRASLTKEKANAKIEVDRARSDAAKAIAKANKRVEAAEAMHNEMQAAKADYEARLQQLAAIVSPPLAKT